MVRVSPFGLVVGVWKELSGDVLVCTTESRLSRYGGMAARGGSVKQSLTGDDVGVCGTLESGEEDASLVLVTLEVGGGT